MSYFKEHYHEFRYPIKVDESTPGFRNAQLGAIHSAAGHLSNRKDPGIITMPTGSGKTAVLIASAFIMQAKRVLIITPSRLVREQIVEEVSKLITLKEAQAIPADIPNPKVKSIQKRISSLEEWETLREFDVVVATIQSISPEYHTIPEPPTDLFDLVLIDEAHHSPARTWQRVLDHFKSSKRLLFTATPFRQDQKEIKGKFIYTYSLDQAYTDGIFGQFSFQAVVPFEGEGHDEAIARATEQKFLSDKRAGYNHRIMVRTDGVPRAKELLELYKRITNLKLDLITGNNTLASVKKKIELLKNGGLDGIVCVNMAGEGFNFPSLKIAAIHAPHKSLNVTLQFVGRFARTAGANLGPATFLAIPSDVKIEEERLYDSRAIWQVMIHNLAALRMNQEIETREALQSFTVIDAVPDLSDLSLYTLEPYYHVKIYQLQGDINIEEEIKFPSRFQMVYHGVSLPLNTAIYITREISLPRWTDDNRLSNLESDLFIFYFDRTSKLFFVCASRKSAGIYEELMDSFTHANPRVLPLVRLNKALNDLTATEFFNVGMRNRVASNTSESYRIIAGSSADKSVLRSDSRLYHRGHAFGKALDRGEQVTIGLSSASKIWSNKSSKLPELIEWCKRLAVKIISNRTPITNSGLDNLSPGEELTELPQNIISADWPKSIYLNPPMAVISDAEGNPLRVPLIYFNLSVDESASTPNATMCVITFNSLNYRFTFSLETNHFFELASENEPEIKVEHGRTVISLIEYINHEMLVFHTNDLALIDGISIFRAPPDSFSPLNTEIIEVTDWIAQNVDTRCEFGDAREGMISIHSYIGSLLESSDADIAYYDHSTGEIADYISFKNRDGRILISFYHCKKSPSANPGHDIRSMSELTTQIVKSVIWTSKQRILDNIRRRYTQRIGAHTFVKGNLEELESLLTGATAASIDFEFIAVQPGLKKDGLTAELSNMLAAGSDYLKRGGYLGVRILSS
ncbi:MAG: DEAD/DEAH box helicase family protein [Saprospiraceae bacterium]|nr:DEAD/DEAH box helicase family protein [Candidatus Defluviibacterium haderslevense]